MVETALKGGASANNSRVADFAPLRHDAHLAALGDLAGRLFRGAVKKTADLVPTKRGGSISKEGLVAGTAAISRMGAVADKTYTLRWLIRGNQSKG